MKIYSKTMLVLLLALTLILTSVIGMFTYGSGNGRRCVYPGD